MDEEKNEEVELQPQAEEATQNGVIEEKVEEKGDEQNEEKV